MQVNNVLASHPRKVTVWCGVPSERIIGPHFFEDPDENAVTIAGERYREILVNFVQPEIANMAGYWGQQDGAFVHTTRVTMQILTVMLKIE